MSDASAAAARSAAAYAALLPAEGAATSALWTWREHPTDGRAVLEIPDTPAGAGLGLTAESYAGLLTGAEIGALVGGLPDDWMPEVE